MELVLLGSSNCDGCRRAEDVIGRVLREQKREGYNIDVRVVPHADIGRLEHNNLLVAKDGNIYLPTICRASNGSLDECISGYGADFEQRLRDLIAHMEAIR